MNYEECLDFLYGRLPMFQNQGTSAYKKDLTNTLNLLEHLGNPHVGIPYIHVAGTNGKGSVSSMIAATLTQSGRKTGLYTSPHLVSFRERIRIDGKEIEEDFVCDFVTKLMDKIEIIRPSFFELTVAMAFDYFAFKQVDIAVIEVGLGGRLDSTNVIEPLVSVITSIGWDHMDMLGNTLEEIAFEKAGIIKANTPIVYSSQIDVAAQETIKKRAKELDAPILISDELSELPDYLSLKGNYQLFNWRTYSKVIELLNSMNFNLNISIQEQALSNVIELTGLRGRWEQLAHNPITICDTGHNAEAIPILMDQLRRDFPDKKYFIVWGMVSDKDRSGILKLLPKKAQYYVCKPDVIRGYHAQLLSIEMSNLGLIGHSYEHIGEAITQAQQDALANNGIVFIGGSTFLVADALKAMNT